MVNNCLECGADIPVRAYPGGSPRRFCSRRCARLGQHRRYHARTAEKHRHEAREWENTRPAYAAFLKQRRRAKARGIEWGLTFEQWLAWWGEDLPLRGRRADGLCMCRVGDSGAYVLGNIYKDTLAGNVSTARQLEAERA